MARQKSKPERQVDDVSALLELAHSVNLLDGYFDDDVADECRLQAAQKAAEINDSMLMGQLEFLLERGWHPSRLRDLIKKA